MPAPQPAIVTEFIYPPIPDRRFDWQATENGWEPGMPVGYGPTEAWAIADLYCRLEECG